MLEKEIQIASRILIVDDNPSNTLLLERVLCAEGYRHVFSTTDGAEVTHLCKLEEIDLILLDLHMPGTDGFEVLRQVRDTDDGSLPILVFTADTTPEAKKQALSAGASDFLTKPGDMTEICLRVANFLKMRQLYRQVQDHASVLEKQVEERTRELQESQVEILVRLAMAAEYRDDDTAQHTKRVSQMSADIAKAMDLPDGEVRIIQYAALLHDVGKIGIPDTILLKPGRLTSQEYETIKRHTVIGAKLLGQSKSKLLQSAEAIAVSHHERWDGSGYPNRLEAEEIPLPGRIVAVADAFDAMTSVRVYKGRMSVSDAVAEVVKCSGTQFDPKVVSAFLSVVRNAIQEDVYLRAA